MKKYRLRKWVEYLLILIAFFSFCIMGSECDDMLIFDISHIIALTIFAISMGILNEYGR